MTQLDELHLKWRRRELATVETELDYAESRYVEALQKLQELERDVGAPETKRSRVL